MKRVGLGVIGVGRMGQTHARAVAGLGAEARLVAVADVREGAARTVAEHCGAARYYTDAEEMLHDPEIQGVIIATPTHTHLAWVRKAAAAGRHILCEKPLTLTLEETDEAIRVARQAGVRLQVGLMRRFDPDVREAKRALTEGRIGKPVIYKAVQRDESAPPPTFCDPAVSGGILVDMGIHEFDVGRWLFGQEVSEVYAVAGPIVHEEVGAVGDIDNVCVQLRLAGGGIGHVDLSRNARYGDDVRFELLGSEGALFWGDLPRRPLTIGGSYTLSQAAVPVSAERFLPAWSAQAASFAAAIRSDRDPEVTGAEARAAFAIALAARRSLETRKPVSLTVLGGAGSFAT